MVNELNKEMSNYQRFLSGEYCNCLDAEVLAMINRIKDYLCVLNDIKTVEYERKGKKFFPKCWEALVIIQV